MAIKTTPAELLDLVFSEMKSRISDFAPADLNALAKTLIAAKQQQQQEAETVKPASNVTSFLNRNTPVKQNATI